MVERYRYRLFNGVARWVMTKMLTEILVVSGIAGSEVEPDSWLDVPSHHGSRCEGI